MQTLGPATCLPSPAPAGRPPYQGGLSSDEEAKRVKTGTRYSGLLMLLVLLLAMAPAFAAPRIGVVTMGPGDVFWERFGHDAIVVDDGAPGGPTSYNFGFFDLAEDGFIGRFVRGEMEYMLVALPLEEDLRYYREVGRGARLQWLDLDPAQAQALAAALAENARPENARYRYDYYTDNCATRVRDAIDRALGGQLRRQLEVRSSGDTYRGESVRLASPAPWMRVGFDLGLGPFADRPLTRWQQAFLPRRLADDLGLADDHRLQAASDREEVLDGALAGVDVQGFDDRLRVGQWGRAQGGDHGLDGRMERGGIEIRLEPIARGDHDEALDRSGRLDGSGEIGRQHLELGEMVRAEVVVADTHGEQGHGFDGNHARGELLPPPVSKNGWWEGVIRLGQPGVGRGADGGPPTSRRGGM